jgi:hypothetical protein
MVIINYNSKDDSQTCMCRDGTQYNNYAEVQYEIPFLGMKRKLHNKNKLESYKEAYTTYEING